MRVATKWTTTVPPVVLFVTLATTAVVTTLVHIHSRRLEQEIAAVGPARDLARVIELAIARQMSSLHSFALTNNQKFWHNFEDDRQREETALQELLKLKPHLKDDVAAPIVRLQELAGAWRNAVDGSTAQSHPRLAPAELEQKAYDDVIEQAAGIQVLLTTDVAQRQHVIDAADRRLWRMTLILTLIALITGVTILWLGHRVRLLALESERRRQELERVMDSRTRFMRGLSHDIRNPLGAVLGYTELLDEGLLGRLEDRQLEIVRRMQRAVGSAISILDDVLVLSQAESGSLSIDRKTLDAIPLLQEVIDDYQPRADQAGLELHASFPTHALSVTTDGARVRQILNNLLSNAIKYTPAPGRVMLAAAVRGSDHTPGPGYWLALEVRDTGPGIPADQRDKVFEEFYRIVDRAHPVPGFGVGLAMSRRIARLLGGDVTIEGAAQGGSVFTLWLPLDDAGPGVSALAAD